MSFHIPPEKPQKSGWYVALTDHLYASFLYYAAWIGYIELIPHCRYVYYFSPLHIWLTPRQHYYWFDLQDV